MRSALDKISEITIKPKTKIKPVPDFSVSSVGFPGYRPVFQKR